MLVRELGLGSGAWLPLRGDHERVDHLLILYRRRAEDFSRSEMGLLDSVTSRLLMSVQARRRAVALELLARSGQMLTRHRQLPSLLSDGTHLLRELVAAHRTVAYSIEDGIARPRARTPSAVVRAPEPGAPPPWDYAEIPAADLPGWSHALDGKPYLMRDDGAAGGSRQLLVVPAGQPGSPDAVLFAEWEELPPLMAPVTETATIFATNITAALGNVSLYRALAKSEASLRLITDSISDLIAVVDAECRLVYASASYDRAVALPSGTLVGRSVLDLVEDTDREALREAVLTAIASYESSSIEYRFHTGDGQVVWAETVLRPAAMPDHSVVMSTRLIQERRQREDQLRHLAAHDPLTGLPNRATATERLQEALTADRPGEIGLLFCDLDKFKQVNDRLGHAAGDDLLQQVAGRLRRCLRSGDLIARLGGDEFIFVLDGVSDLSEVTDVGRRVAASIARPFLLGGEVVQVAVSVGAAVGARRQASAAKLLAVADAAMYQAKQRGNSLDRESITRVVG